MKKHACVKLFEMIRLVSISDKEVLPGDKSGIGINLGEGVTPGV
jgi:hypothetical protein